MSNVHLALSLVLGALLACAVAQVVMWRYRRAMTALMSAPLSAPLGVSAPSGADAAPVLSATPPVARAAPPAPITLAGNRRAAWRISILLIVLVLLIGATSAVVTIILPGNAIGFSWNRIASVAVVQAWPVLPALALLWHWPRRRLLFALLAWLLLAAVFVMWRSDDNATWTSTLAYLMVAEIGVPLALGALLTAGRATRAVAPWLWIPLTAAAAAALTPLVLVMSRGAERLPSWYLDLALRIGLDVSLILGALAALALALLPLRALGRALAAAYRRKWLTELMVVFAALVGIVQVLRVETGLGANGAAALAYLLPLAWIPLGLAVMRHLGQPAGRPPRLLVLRVFQRDEAVNRLFDEVIERWRLTGNTMLIAGTDLAERTVDAEDIYLFLDRRLRERFVLDAASLPPLLAAFDFERDADGRYRINEVYCHDHTWEQALDALVARADVVLMDLRGFQSRNRGCRHELGVLARAPGIERVLVLVDEHTERAAADAAAAGAPPGRFEWIDASHIERGSAAQVMERLFVAG